MCKSFRVVTLSSIFSIIYFIIYIPLIKAETPDHIGLYIEHDISELSLNDSYYDIEDFFHLSVIEQEKDNEENVNNMNNTNPTNTSKIIIDNVPDYPIERGVYLVKEGMPKNTRHLKEGYWIGALPDISNIQAMKEHGIKVILTVTIPKHSWNPVKQKINELGIEHIIIPVGSRFPKDTSFYDKLLNYDPNEIFVHCDHGGDRSGTFIAYLLARRNHWAIQRALLAMVNPSKVDVNELKKVLKQYGYEITQEDLQFSSIYSGSSNGGFGGLKVRNEDYKRLVFTMLDVL